MEKILAIGGPGCWPSTVDAGDAVAEMNAHVMAVRTPIVIMSRKSGDASVA